MARGWESKSVESQIESFTSDRRSSSSPEISKDDAERQRQRESLQLSRTRVLHDIEQSHNPRHLKILQDSLEFLNTKLADLDGPT